MHTHWAPAAYLKAKADLGRPDFLDVINADLPRRAKLMAEGGPVWSCGYDDHSLPPIRGGGNQGNQYEQDRHQRKRHRVVRCDAIEKTGGYLRQHPCSGPAQRER